MWDFIIRLLLAALAGFLIGMANKTASNPSGRVFSIICVGSTLVTITSIEFFKILALPWVSDPGRLSAQIISALGFIGTGFIWMTEKQHIRGISVASSLWLTAILGILIGVGLRDISIIALAFLAAIYYLSHLVERVKK